MRVVRVGCAAGAVLALWLAPVATGSPPLPSVDTITPGVGLATYDPAVSFGNTCTAGFLVRTKSGDPAMLSAGHCDAGGRVEIKLSGSYTTVGTFINSIHQGDAGEANDIGVVSLMPGLPINPAVAGVEAVTGATDQLTVGETLCKFGLNTDRQCGPITAISPSKVTFAATTECGDSGGPVYAINPNGTVTAVGITIRATMGADSDPAPCSSDYTVTVAELVAPWLHKWALTVLTS